MPISYTDYKFNCMGNNEYCTINNSQILCTVVVKSCMQVFAFEARNDTYIRDQHTCIVLVNAMIANYMRMCTEKATM